MVWLRWLRPACTSYHLKLLLALVSESMTTFKLSLQSAVECRIFIRVVQSVFLDFAVIGNCDVFGTICCTCLVTG